MNDQLSSAVQAYGAEPRRFDARQLPGSDAASGQLEERVLVVDDDQLFCSQLSTGLKRHGLAVLPTDNRRVALELAHTHLPHFAILELRLLHDPNAFHSGLELIRTLRKLNPPMRIVVVTGYSSIVTAVAAIKAGAMDYLVKPADIGTVAAALTKREQDPDLRAYPMAADRLRWEYILRVFFQCDQNVSATARVLGMHRRTLQRMLNKRPPPE
ncbi:MAG: response regulator transcription factor [Geminicoccaceae bacterium]